MKPPFNSFRDAQIAWREDAPILAKRFGIINPYAVSYLPNSDFANDKALAQENLFSSDMVAPLAGFAVDASPIAVTAQPTLTTSPNSALPVWFTMYQDPEVYKVLFAKNMAAQIFGEKKQGDWLTETAMFFTVEHTGEVSSYDDFSESGNTNANFNYPQRQSYLYQTIKEYGDRQAARAGLAQLSWASELDTAAALAMGKFENLTYFFGVKGLQNYGWLNDPALTAALTPITKAAGGNTWVTNGVITATPNEILTDIQSLFIALVNQTQGLVDEMANLTLVGPPAVMSALTATNSFNVNVYALLKENFPNLKFARAVQYGTANANNPQGLTGGNLVQLVVDQVEAQRTGFCAFTEKMRSHAPVRGLSSWKQKVTGGSFGAVIRQPFGIAQMIGV